MMMKMIVKMIMSIYLLFDRERELLNVTATAIRTVRLIDVKCCYIVLRSNNIYIRDKKHFITVTMNDSTLFDYNFKKLINIHIMLLCYYSSG